MVYHMMNIVRKVRRKKRKKPLIDILKQGCFCQVRSQKDSVDPTDRVEVSLRRNHCKAHSQVRSSKSDTLAAHTESLPHL